jgi:hypothetical protein
MARAALRWGAEDLAAKALVARATVIRLEADLPARSASLVAIQAVLEQAGVVFIRNARGNSVQLTHAAECMCDLVKLAAGIDDEMKAHVAIRHRIDRLLDAPSSADIGRAVLADLKRRLAREGRNSAAPTREVLGYALSYIRQTVDRAD